MSKAKSHRNPNGQVNNMEFFQAIKDEFNKTASSQELADRFHVSKSTVHASANKLRKMNVDIPKKRNHHNWEEIVANLK